MFGEYTNSIVIVLLVALAIFIYSQKKFDNKMLCYFIRPNKTRFKKFVPMYYTHVEFKRGKYGTEKYRINWKYVTHERYTGGINKLFPVWIPTFEFYWNNPNPVDPDTGQASWHTPEVEAAGYQGHGYTAFARAAMQQAGGKRDKLQWIMTIVIAGLVIVSLLLIYTQGQSMAENFQAMQQQIDLLK